MARRNSLAWWEEQLKSFANSCDDLEEQIWILRDFISDIASDMLRFEKEEEIGPTEQEIADALRAMKRRAKDELKTNFAWAAAGAPDITDPMLAHLLNMVDEHLNPQFVLLNNGNFQLKNLIQDCNNGLGTVETWFDIVDSVRITNANSDAARMIGWRKLYDAAILGYVVESNIKGYDKKGNPKMGQSKWNDEDWLTATYFMIIADRESALTDTAGYWHFLEYGNKRRRQGARYPHPKYGAQKAVTQAEAEINRAGVEMGVGITTTERRRTKGYYDRQKLIDKAKWLIEDIYEELERLEQMRQQETLDELARRIRGKVTKEVKARIAEYQGMETLEDLNMDDYHRIRDKIIDAIANYQDYSSERVSDVALPSGMRTREIRMDIETYLEESGFGDISIREIFYL